MWQCDYFANCDKCGNVELMDGCTKLDAARVARLKGWFISATRILCPTCKPPNTGLQSDGGYAPANGAFDLPHAIDCVRKRYGLPPAAAKTNR